MTPDPVPADLLAARDVAVALAREAGALQIRERPGVVRATKAHRNDQVSDVDLASEALIVDGLRAAPCRPSWSSPRHPACGRSTRHAPPCRR